ncbi:MAG: DUF3568 domain-containing protein [Candidatus Omnitrophica bacterium]|nr:DUF3568 domain-containing protein [Candidatus Omnitrophota bacterium]MCM8823651.1 DUF3568 domain-containing protein [Candidatus Omnitrophota bacterium]MCM8826526.1 DUF3568 domain-containing protein [Candidatus Omnitrophota bacterium]
MSKRIKIIVLVIVIILGFCLVRDFFIKSIIETVISNLIGTPTRIGSFSLSVVKQSIKISNFKMYNPKGFPQDILIDIPQMGVEYDLGALLKGKVHFKRVDFELKEIAMVKNKEGKLNIDSLKIMEGKSKSTKEKKVEKPQKEIALHIDLMNLGIGRIVSKDYSVEGSEAIKVYDINLEKRYENINSLNQLVLLIIAEPLRSAGIQGLKVYTVSLLTGIAALPVAVAVTFAGRDYAQASLEVNRDKVYEIGLEMLKQMGVIKKEDSKEGVINAEVSGANVTFKLKKIDDKTTEITVYARKVGIPKPEIASGVIYKIQEQLKAK